jgi:6-phosphogluconolactonase
VTTTDVRIIGNVEDLAATVAREVALVLDSSVNQCGSASIVLAGGRTPRRVYQRIAASHRDHVPWDQVHFYWGDERHVAHDDDRSNYHVARESLFDALPVLREHVHAMPTGVATDRAAEEYEQTLRSRFTSDWPTFDLVLPGVGEDGHTASLFPASPALREFSRWVIATDRPGRASPPSDTDGSCHYSREVNLRTGDRVRESGRAVRCGLSDRSDPRWPVSLMSTTRGRLVCWLDADAAANVSTKDRR